MLAQVHQVVASDTTVVVFPLQMLCWTGFISHTIKIPHLLLPSGVACGEGEDAQVEARLHKLPQDIPTRANPFPQFVGRARAVGQ